MRCEEMSNQLVLILFWFITGSLSVQKPLLIKRCPFCLSVPHISSSNDLVPRVIPCSIVKTTVHIHLQMAWKMNNTNLESGRVRSNSVRIVQVRNHYSNVAAKIGPHKLSEYLYLDVFDYALNSKRKVLGSKKAHILSNFRKLIWISE